MASTTEGVDDPNRSQRWDSWIEPDRQSVDRGDAMSGRSICTRVDPCGVPTYCPQFAHSYSRLQ
ncbi:MAG: hypothetical protein QOJ61_3060 [Mycobacterium sp.]|nr:hypothetical protein [Mycobacterium sp.]